MEGDELRELLGTPNPPEATDTVPLPPGMS